MTVMTFKHRPTSPNSTGKVTNLPTAALPTSEAARCLAPNYGTTVAAMLSACRPERGGNYKGLIPTRLPNGRFVWDRAQVMKLAGQHMYSPRVSIDVRATVPFLANAGLPESDPVTELAAVALCHPVGDPARDVAEHLDACFALKDWVQAQHLRLYAARDRMTPEQRTDAIRLMARAVASVVSATDDDVMAQAVADYLGSC